MSIHPDRIKNLLTNRGPLSTDAICEIMSENRLDILEAIHFLEARNQIRIVDSVEIDKEDHKRAVKAYKVI